MVDFDKLNGEVADLLLIARLDLYEFRLFFRRDLLEPALYKSNRQLRCVDWRADLLKQVWYCADVVFMAVGDQDRLYPGFVFSDITEVRNDVINARHFFSGEHDAAVYYYDFIPVFEECYIFTYTPEPSQGNYLYCLMILHIMVILLNVRNRRHFARSHSNHWLR